MKGLMSVHDDRNVLMVVWDETTDNLDFMQNAFCIAHSWAGIEGTISATIHVFPNRPPMVLGFQDRMTGDDFDIYKQVVDDFVKMQEDS